MNQIYSSVIRAPVVGLRPPIGNCTVFLEVRTRYNWDYFIFCVDAFAAVAGLVAVDAAVATFTFERSGRFVVCLAFLGGGRGWGKTLSWRVELPLVVWSALCLCLLRVGCFSLFHDLPFLCLWVEGHGLCWVVLQG